eukprot:scaffold5771_cov202-Prasinococcus_capsulatus_cf.AAC.1
MARGVLAAGPAVAVCAPDADAQAERPSPYAALLRQARGTERKPSPAHRGAGRRAGGRAQARPTARLSPWLHRAGSGGRPGIRSPRPPP